MQISLTYIIKKTKLFSFLVVLVLATTFTSCNEENEELFKLSSHSNTIEIFKSKDNQLTYKIVSNKKIVIDSSALGIIVNGKTLGKDATIKLIETSDANESFLLSGVKEEANYTSKKTIFELTEKDGFKWYLDFQVSDQGIAYRYRVPGSGVQKITEELSSFKIPNNTKVWFFERNSDWKLKSHAGEWLSADISKMETISKMGPIQGLTLTLELPQGGYALIAEAALYNYSGSRLKAIGNNTFQTNFTEGDNGFNVNGDINSPWRCILLANDLNALVNNTMVASLNPAPNKELFKDTSWIKPGKSAWYWWSGKRATPKAEKQMVNDAVALGLQYTMVDEGWELWNNKWNTTKELCNHAKTSGIGIFLWKHSDQLNYPENDYEVMRHFLDSVKSVGAVGVKVDFMNGQSKSLIDFDENLLKKAAERQLMVNFHGCQHSSGEYRTYPNEVTREGIRGIEVNGMDEGMLKASHNAALPFTRYVTGHADYTPIGFTNPGETTWAHQLATLVCFYSPFQCIAENSQFLLTSKQVKPALEFIKDVPSVWDETKVLPSSEIGELAIIARRKGNDWYLGVLNGGDAKKITIPCDFLKEENYQTEIFKDDLKAGKFDITGLHPRQFFKEFNRVTLFTKEKLSTNKTSNIVLDLEKNGGAVVWFKSQKNN